MTDKMRFKLSSSFDNEEVRHTVEYIDTEGVAQKISEQVMKLTDRHTVRALVKLGWIPPVKKARKPSEVRALFESFMSFLEEHGYIDDDWRVETPTAIEQYFEEIGVINRI